MTASVNNLRSSGWLSQSISDLVWYESSWLHNPCAIWGQNTWPFLPPIQSGIRERCTGYLSAVRIISLYLWYQVEFVIIIGEFWATSIRITHLNHIIRGWTVPLTISQMEGGYNMNLCFLMLKNYEKKMHIHSEKNKVLTHSSLHYWIVKHFVRLWKWW